MNDRTSALSIAPPVVLSWRPHDKSMAALFDLCAVVGGSFLVALLAQVSIPMWPVPITGSTLALLVVGSCFGARLGFFAVCLYLLEGALGLVSQAGRAIVSQE